MYKNYIYFILGLFILSSCGGNASVVPTANYTQFELKIAPKIGSKSLELGKYFVLSSDDSVMVSRLDFYVSHLTFFDTISNTSGTSTLYLFSQKTKDTIVYIDSSKSLKHIHKINFMAGLNDFANNANPTSFAFEHPQSTSKSMYWNEWTKYRFIIFEGEIKKKTGEKVAFSYHTGLTFKREIEISKTIAITQGVNNKIQLNLALDKIFYPTNSGNNLEVFNGENQGHADASDIFITNKFLANFSMAFDL
jgi:hypothetical protein